MHVGSISASAPAGVAPALTAAPARGAGPPAPAPLATPGQPPTAHQHVQAVEALQAQSLAHRTAMIVAGNLPLVGPVTASARSRQTSR